MKHRKRRETVIKETKNGKEKETNKMEITEKDRMNKRNKKKSKNKNKNTATEKAEKEVKEIDPKTR